MVCIETIGLIFSFEQMRRNGEDSRINRVNETESKIQYENWYAEL